MNENTKCPSCARELTGAIETTKATQGIYVFVVQRETSDCNWTRCSGCKTVACKRCRRERPKFCCEVGRTVDTERVRVAASNPNEN
jgi:hypothetical protein